MVKWWCCTSDARLTKHSVGKRNLGSMPSVQCGTLLFNWRLQCECPNLWAPWCTRWLLHSLVHQWPSWWACAKWVVSTEAIWFQVHASSHSVIFSHTCSLMQEILFHQILRLTNSWVYGYQELAYQEQCNAVRPVSAITGASWTAAETGGCIASNMSMLHFWMQEAACSNWTGDCRCSERCWCYFRPSAFL